MEIRFDLHWCLGLAQAEPVEPELFRLLQAIQERGTLRVAAKDRGVSYRYAWGLMQKWERSLGQPLACMERGRGTTLTPLGKKLLWGHRRIIAHLGPELDSIASQLASELRAAMKVESAPPVRVFASHGLAIPLLRDLLRVKRGLEIELQFRGSLDCLRLLSQSKCDLAGFHLPEGSLGARLAPHFQRWLDPENEVLIHAVRRRQGLIIAKDNPKGIRSVADLVTQTVRFVNRQPGSGTRLIFDLLLEDANVVPERIQGYNVEEFTHMAVAAMVASGGADAGFGIEAAARHFGLYFIPVTWENYWFAVRRGKLASFAVSEIVSTLRSTEFKEQAGALPGYDTARAGVIVPLDSQIAYGEMPLLLDLARNQTA
ncbi:MAG: substrate-binding domain-containing protein [Gammaproteobacteria bacterium]